jgi:hypothetical protein
VTIFQSHVRINTQRLYENATVDTLKRALLVAVLQNEEILQRDISRIFARQVPDRRIPADVALEFGDMYSLRLLQGAAHYVYLMDATTGNDAEAVFEIIKFGQGIDENLQHRLLHGYWSLMRTCLRLRSAPPLDLTTCQSLRIAEWHRSYNFALMHLRPIFWDCSRKLANHCTHGAARTAG